MIWVLSAGGVCMVFLLCWFVYRWFCCGYRLVACGCFLVLLAVVGLARVVLGVGIDGTLFGGCMFVRLLLYLITTCCFGYGLTCAGGLL